MFYDILYLFLLFFIYSVLGYIAEVIYVSIVDKKLTLSRGFLVGPYIPIYGAGAIIMTRLLTGYKDDIIALFVMSFVSCSILEYLTSFVMEKIFKLRWWDYGPMKFNVNGRICLTTSSLFGIAGVLITKFINPLVETFLLSFSKNLIIIVSIICLIIFLIDVVFSILLVLNIKVDVKKYYRKDATDMVKKELNDTFIYLKERLTKAYPHAKSYLKQHANFNFKSYKKYLDKIISEIKKDKNNTTKKNL